MAATKWTIRNYNAFIKGVRKEYGISLTVARQSYRNMRGLYGPRVRAVDIQRHPVSTKRSVNRAIVAQIPTEPVRESVREPEITLEWWLENYDEDWEELDGVEFEGMYETTSDQ